MIARLAALGALLVLASCGRSGTQVLPRPPLLDRAISAAGGEAALASIRSIEARTSGVQKGGGAYKATIQRLLPEGYRHDVEVSDAVLVQATDGKDIWATLDDHPIPILPADAESLRLSWRLANMSMLLPLKSVEGLSLKEEGVEDGVEVLRVTFPEAPGLPRGPYRLCFDAKTGLLSRIEFEAEIFGAKGPRPTTIELLDYRMQQGVMIPFGSRMTVAGEIVSEDTFSDVTINPPLGVERFRRPPAPADLVIRRRTTGETTVALIEQHGEQPEAAGDAEAALQKYVDRHRFERIGPPFRLQPLLDGDVPAVGVPIAAPGPETRPSAPASREDPRVADHAARLAFTTMIPAADPKARSTAIERLLSRVRSDGFEVDGPCKIVSWSADVVQLQIPVRTRKD